MKISIGGSSRKSVQLLTQLTSSKHGSHQMLGGVHVTQVPERRPMLVESLINETVDLQGFRVISVEKVADGLEAKLVPTGVLRRARISLSWMNWGFCRLRPRTPLSCLRS